MHTELIGSDWTGQIVDGRFALLQSLGNSDRRAVYLTELRGPGSQKAAIKLVPADAESAEAQLAGWAAAAQLSHPHLMHLLHSGRCQVDGVPLLYVVTEYAQESLAKVLLERALSPDEAAEMLTLVLRALAYLHQNGFVHGQVKPANILVVDEQLRLSSDSLHAAGAMNSLLFEPEIYRAPEYADGVASYSADIWSLGITLVEAMTQHLPRWNELAHTAPIIPDLVPQPFFEMAEQCVRADPQLRCTVSDLENRLRPSRPSPVAVPLEPPRGEPRAEELHGASRFLLRAWMIVAAALVLVAAIAVFAGLRLESRHPQAPRAGQRPTSAPVVASPLPVTRPASSAAAVPLAPPTTGSVIERVLPQVPPKASQTIRGSFDLGIRVNVDSSGAVSNAELTSPGPSKYFASLALEAARAWKFKPPQREGRGVPSIWTMRFVFSQTAVEVTPVEVEPSGAAK